MEGGFLPPEPPGPEPELGPRPQSAAPPPPPAPQQPTWQQPQPTWQQPAPPGYWQPQWQAPGPQEPDNGPAVAGFVLALVAAVLLLLSVLLLAFLSLILAVIGLVYSRRGKRKVQAGETTRHRSLAQAGFVINIVTLVIAVPATLLEIVFLIAYATDEEFRENFNDDLEREFETDPSDGTETFTILIRVVVPVARGIARLIA